MITEGLVQEIGRTEKGNPKAKINGEWFFGSPRVDLSTLQVGSRVGVEYELFGPKNNLKGIKSWGVLPVGNPTSPVNATPPVGQPLAPQPHIEEHVLRFVSNVVGQAIAAGAIKTPAEISPWYNAALDAANGLPGDESIPF
jgi:hypothetical protein